MNVADILAALPVWQGLPEILPLAAGRTNQNYLVTDGTRRYFARIGSDRRDLGINRDSEAACCQLAAAHGIGPAVLHAGDGILVQTFLPAETLHLEATPDPSMLTDLAALLRRLHGVSAHGNLPPFDPVAICGRYLADLHDRELPESRHRIAERLLQLRPGKGKAFLHGDLIPENVLRANGRLYLIDWEYAGLGAPETDLALVLANFGLSPTDTAHFLSAYGDHDAALLADMTIACVIREALWCLMQGRRCRATGEDPGDLPDYTKLCLGRLREALA